MHTDWFTDARFGIFSHWGLYSLPAGVWDGERMGGNWYAEWIQMQGNWPHGIPLETYRALAADFNPTAFDADAWMAEVKNAGAAYFLITAKHHDGFALWPSRVSDYNVVDATPFGRDVLAELRAACDRHGLRLGFYYSHWMDWEHPGGARPKATESAPERTQPSDAEYETYWTEKCLPQVRELLEGYAPAFLWFDNWRADDNLTAERLDRLIDMIRDVAPDCLINSRIGTTWNHPDGDARVDYLSMGDNEFPDRMIEQPWETSGTLNRSWGHHRLDHAWLPPRTLLANLVGNVSRNGNYQLNVGPTGDGRLCGPTLRRLREIGAWMHINHEAVRGCGPAPAPRPDWGSITAPTKTGDRWYLHVTGPGQTASLTCPRPPRPVAACTVLETGEALDWRTVDDTVRITAPETWPDERITVVRLDLGEGP